MTCKGTMAKTYDNGKIIEGRDNLNGDYFMQKGKLIQVPHGNMGDGKPYSYGLKAFRCWFELNGNTSSEGNRAKYRCSSTEWKTAPQASPTYTAAPTAHPTSVA